jgi:hypothetical protein
MPVKGDEIGTLRDETVLTPLRVVNRHKATETWFTAAVTNRNDASPNQRSCSPTASKRAVSTAQSAYLAGVTAAEAIIAAKATVAGNFPAQ